VLTVARPFLQGATKAAVNWLFRTDDEGFQKRLADIRQRAARQRGEAAVPDEAASSGPDTEAPAPGTSS